VEFYHVSSMDDSPIEEQAPPPQEEQASPPQSPAHVKVEPGSSPPRLHDDASMSGDIAVSASGPDQGADVKVKLQADLHSDAASIFSEFGSSSAAQDAPFEIESILAAQNDLSQSAAEFMMPAPRVETGGVAFKLFDSSPIPPAAEADVKFLTDNPYASLRWTALITRLGDVASQWPPAFVRNVLQSCLSVYRRSPNVWMLYIKHLWDARDLALAMKQFQTCLHLCPHVELFRVYLKCMRVIFQDKFQDGAARDLLRHAHEFAVEKIGMDVFSLPIWQEYIALLKDLNLDAEVRCFHLQMRHRFPLLNSTSHRPQLRAAYKRCIVIPIADVERVKNDWDDFERSRKLQNKGEIISKATLDLVRVPVTCRCWRPSHRRPQVRTSKTYSTDRVQMANATGNISTQRGLFSNFSAPCPDSVDGQVDGWDAEGYHAALQNWMKCGCNCAAVDQHLTPFYQAHRCGEEIQRKQRGAAAAARDAGPAAMRHVHAGAASNFNRLARYCSYSVTALFSRMVSFGILCSRKRTPRHESGGCIAAGRGHHSAPLSRSSTHVGLFRSFCFLTISLKRPCRFCDFLEAQGNVAAALDVHTANTRLCHSAVAWVQYLSFCRRAVSVSSFRYHRHTAPTRCNAN
jgi:hypothetical protein